MLILIAKLNANASFYKNIKVNINFKIAEEDQDEDATWNQFQK